jgi:hypothetical protein
MKTLSAVRLVATCLGLFVLLPDAGARIARASSLDQAETLASLVWGILACETHPCGQDSPRHVRALLENRIVSDGSFQYSDLALTYSDLGADLKGVVEWDLAGGVDEISLIVVGFDDSEAALKSAMEAALPGCVIESTPDDDDDAPADDPSAAADSAAADDPAAAASARPEDLDCTVDLPGGRKADITIHVAPETLMIEVI